MTADAGSALIGAPLAATGPAVGFGTVWHRRNRPRRHQFTYPVNFVWIDPDRPGDLFGRHWLWSDRKLRPIQFRRTDYLDGTVGPIGPTVVNQLAGVLGSAPDGPVRMLTQPRTWGWVFNPITVYLAWDGEEDGDPVGAVLEVTNTPWKERTLYPIPLQQAGARLLATFDKSMHVSPFLDQEFEYRLSIENRTTDRSSQPLGSSRLVIDIDVHRSGQDDPTVETSLDLRLHQPDRKVLGAALRRNPMPTHRVSLGIHWQAARLAAKRIPFVPHPGRQS